MIRKLDFAAAVIVLSSAALVHAQIAPPVAETAAQAQNAPPATEAAGSAQEPIDEVIVRGERQQLFRLRTELQVAREHVWDVFNTINSDDDFDIACKDYAPNGSHIKRRVCRPQYSGKGTSRAGKELVRRIHECDPTRGDFSICLEGAMTSGSAQAQKEIGRINGMDQRLDAEFQQLVLEHPELATAILEYQAKQRELTDAIGRRKD